MKKISGTCLISCVMSLISFSSHAQQGEWTWMKGDNTASSNGNFGTQGIADPGNFPRANYSYTGWKDLQGNFWIFGGGNSSTFYSDLWKYDPVTNEWTWVRGSNLANEPGVYGTLGVPSSANQPGARSFGARSWTDDNGYLWLMGGYGYGSASLGDLNDLWRYDIDNNEWTWMSGSNDAGAAGVYGTFQTPDPANTPGARHESTACWKDVSGNLWFYSGYDFSQSFCDMWKYDPSTNQWTWMNGTSGSLAANYGTLGVADPANTPGSRMAYSHFTDASGNFWFFGGVNYSHDPLGDFWMYDPVTNEWTWMGGSQTIYSPGNAGSLCDTSTLYYPCARFENRCSWTDECHHFWMTAGSSDFFSQPMNDLWVFDPQTKVWSWVNGSLSSNAAAVTGTQGVSDPGNNPGGLICPIGFVDESNNLFLFGGSTSGLSPYNDLWKFTIDPSCPAMDYSCPPVFHPSFASSDTDVCEKFCINFYDSSQNNPTAWQWLFPGGDPSASALQNPTGICYDVPGVYDVTLITTSAGGNDTLTLSNYITVNATPPFPGITQDGYTLTSSSANSYQWQLNSVDIPGATNQSYNVLQTGYYTVIVSDSNGCDNSATLYVLISGVDEMAGDAGIFVYPNPSSGNFIVEFKGLASGEIGDASIDIVNTLGKKVFSSIEKITAAHFKKEIDLSEGFANGVYFIEIKTGRVFVRKKILIVD